MRSFGIDDKDRGSSSIWLLARFRISRLVRLAKPGGTAIKLHYLSFWKANLGAGLVLHFSLLWLKVNLVMFSMFTGNGKRFFRKYVFITLQTSLKLETFQFNF